MKFDIYSSSSSGLNLFIHKETGILVCFEDGVAYFQGIFYNERPYTEGELERIKDWVSATGIRFSFYRYKVYEDVLRNARIQHAFEEPLPTIDDSDDSECEY
jgi:hypothetical protein